MSITNMQATEKLLSGTEKQALIKKYIASLISGIRNREVGQLPTTARGRALYTIDYFLNGKPELSNHDSSGITFRNRFAS